MKQLLKETIIVWLAIILVVAFIFTLVAVPCFIFAHAGSGVWQSIVSILWLTFWIALGIAIAKRP